MVNIFLLLIQKHKSAKKSSAILHFLAHLHVKKMPKDRSYPFSVDLQYSKMLTGLSAQIPGRSDVYPHYAKNNRNKYVNTPLLILLEFWYDTVKLLYV